MKMGIGGMVFVVTGGSSGIGRAIVEGCLQEGARVVTCHLNDSAGEKGLLESAERLGMGEMLTVVNADMSRKESAEKLASLAMQKYGKLDVWVNNAAFQKLARSEELDEKEWHSILAVNLDGYFFGCQAAAKRFIEGKGGGSIINITSGVNALAVRNLAAYAASKGAVRALTRVLAVEWGGHGIRVNAIAPGATDTPMNMELYTSEVRALYNDRIPLGHIASTAEIADAVLMLASPYSRYITGEEILVDGGLNFNGTVYRPLG